MLLITVDFYNHLSNFKNRLA